MNDVKSSYKHSLVFLYFWDCKIDIGPRWSDKFFPVCYCRSLILQNNVYQETHLRAILSMLHSHHSQSKFPSQLCMLVAATDGVDMV